MMMIIIIIIIIMGKKYRMATNEMGGQFPGGMNRPRGLSLIVDDDNLHTFRPLYVTSFIPTLVSNYFRYAVVTLCTPKLRTWLFSHKNSNVINSVPLVMQSQTVSFGIHSVGRLQGCNLVSMWYLWYICFIHWSSLVYGTNIHTASREIYIAEDLYRNTGNAMWLLCQSHAIF